MLVVAMGRRVTGGLARGPGHRLLLLLLCAAAAGCPFSCQGLLFAGCRCSLAGLLLPFLAQLDCHPEGERKAGGQPRAGVREGGWGAARGGQKGPLQRARCGGGAGGGEVWAAAKAPSLSSTWPPLFVTKSPLGSSSRPSNLCRGAAGGKRPGRPAKSPPPAQDAPGALRSLSGRGESGGGRESALGREGKAGEAGGCEAAPAGGLQKWLPLPRPTPRAALWHRGGGSCASPCGRGGPAG